MTEAIAPKKLDTVSIPELRRFLIESGFTSQGSWGRFLERFHLEHGKESYDVLVPTSRDIADYRDRIKDALRDLSLATESATSDVLSRVLVSEYREFRIRAHPGADISSIPFDEGVALLSNGKTLIRSSAVSAYSRKHKPVIRGRSSVAVEEYMDRVQLGQSDIGSYVFTILLPRDETMFGIPADPGKERSSDTVLETLEKSIVLAAEMAVTRRVPSLEQSEQAGLSANFCESLYNMIDWSEKVTLELPLPRRTGSSVPNPAYSFDRTTLSILERTADKLNPHERKTEKTVSGTVTRLSEPQIKRKGSIDLRVRLDGRQRSVRIIFGFEDRDTIITAFREKASRFLTVSGYLKTERNGHLVMEEPRDFAVSRRGGLV